MIYFGELLTDWDAVNRQVLVRTEHPYNEVVLQNEDGDNFTVYGNYSPAVTQDPAKIGTEITWVVARYYVDETTYNNLKTDKKYQILWTDTEYES